MRLSIGLRRTFGVLFGALLGFGIACADKTLAPSAPASPRFSLRVSTIGRQSLAAQKLVIAAAYFSSVLDADGDSSRVLDIASMPSSGGAQSATLNIDLSSCLADQTRRGSNTACSMYVGAFLEPTTYDLDSGSVFGRALDFQLLGPFDASPGHAPTIPTIDLSTSRFAVNEWVADEALRVGGDKAPYGLNGFISGVPGANPGDPPTLFGLEIGALNVSTNPNAPSFQQVGQLTIYQNGAWRRIDGPRGATTFLSVAGFAANDVYVGGTNGLYHYDGSAITQVAAVPTGVGVASVAVTGSGSTKLVIFGTQTGIVWIGSGTTFTRYTTPLNGITGTAGIIDGVCINSATEAFASSRNGGGLLHFDGTTWTSVPATLTGGKVDLQCLGPGQAYVTNQGSGNLLKWNGSGWTSLPVPTGINGRSLNFGVISANEIYALGDSGNTNRAYYRYDGNTWREIARTSFNGFYLQHPWADLNGHAIYVGSAPSQSMRIDKVTSSGTSIVSYSPALRGVSMPATTTAFVVGGNYLLARWNGARWTVDAPPAGTPTNLMLQGVWSDAANNAWAVGQSSAIAHWDGTQWTFVSDARRPVASPADNYNAVWGSGGNVWIAGDASIIRCKPSSPTAGAAISCAADPVSGQGPFYAIWGTSPTNAFAVGANGHIVHFDGTSWSSMPSPTTGRLGAIGGTGPSDVWAVGDTVALHYDGAKWSAATRSLFGDQYFGAYSQSSLSFQTALWIIDPTEAYVGTAFGEILRGPLFWETMTGPFFNSFVGRVTGVAGVARGCALAISDGQSAPGGAILLRGVGQSGCLNSAMTGPAAWP